MTDTLVDTNIILDIAEEDADWQAWSERWLANAAENGDLLINQVVYAELAAGYATREALNAALDGQHYRREDIPWDAAYAAGHAYLAYGRRGGARTSPLPDFFIGAHAAVRGYTLLTRDRGFYAAYFPTLALVSPETHP